MKKENININYPRFIPNKPCGIDKFEGKSQERLTDAIANHIVSIDNDKDMQNLSRIIGLEGGWGVGKSNVIKQLKEHESIKNTYYLFEYDAWGHQEDLQRRSFLELLTSELIDKEILTGNTTIKIKGGGIETVTWDKKLKYLLARKTETITEKYPRISNSVIASFLVAILTPIFMYIGFLAKTSITILWLSILLPIIISLLPIIITFMVWLIAKKKDSKYSNLDYLLAIYNDKIENDICYETISEEEPTVTEFKDWMQDISKHIGKQSKKLIIVYDNMDRLPPEKVKELWSSIHTFFSESNFDNIWTIIPFDEKHLYCAFGKSDDKEREQLTKNFICKTFPVVYRVTPPVITDYKKIFNTLFEEAFGNSKQEEEISRIFRLEKPDATVREIIVFINQLVALHNIWQNEIDVLYIAIFALKKEDILSNPVEQIISGKYLGTYIPNIIPDDELMQKCISALVYGVPLNKAEQVPMLKYLDSCFNLEKDADINKSAASTNFIDILSEKADSVDNVQIDNAISCLSKLNTSEFVDDDKKRITAIWDRLAKEKMKTSLATQEFPTSFQNLLLHTSYTTQYDTLKYLCKQIQQFEPTKFSGKNYFISLSNIKDFVAEHEINFDILDSLQKTKTDSKSFIDYVITAKDSYSLFELTTDPNELDNYLTVLSPVADTWKQLELPENQKGLTDYSHSYIVEFLNRLNKSEIYKFGNLYSKIEEELSNATADNFKRYC